MAASYTTLGKEPEDNHGLSTMTHFGVTTTKRGGPGTISHTQMSSEIIIVSVASKKIPYNLEKVTSVDTN